MMRIQTEILQNQAQQMILASEVSIAEIQSGVS